MKYFVPLFIFLFLFSCVNSKSNKNSEEWTSLWNGEDLTGWDTYFASPFSGADKTQSGFIGLNNPEQDIIKVVKLEDGNAIRISGVAWGGMFTKQDYGNFHLKLKMKWGKDMHKPREKGPRDSGLLYDGFGGPGSEGVWMSSQELQIQEGDIGDYWPTGDIKIDVPSKLHDSLYYQYDEQSPLRTYYYAQIVKEGVHDSLAKRRVLKFPDRERPYGEWNDIDLICYGDSSVHVVNGTVVMRLYNSRKMNDDSPVTAGKLILQSEGAEVYYKDIYIKPIDKMPEL